MRRGKIWVSVAFLAVCLLFDCDRRCSAQGISFPAERWQQVSPDVVGMESKRLEQARDYALTGGGAGMITRYGKLVFAWGDTSRKFDLKSSSKSIGVTALGLAMDDGKISLRDFAEEHHSEFATPPESNRETGWQSAVTIEHLATQTAGFDKPGGYERLLFAPGSKWHYSDGGPNWLAECVTLSMQRDIQSLMFERILTPIGVTKNDLNWRNHAYRDHKLQSYRRYEFGSGVHANVDAMARIGLLYLARGKWLDRRLFSESFVDEVRRPRKFMMGLPEHDGQHGNASDHYGLLWWNNHDATLAGVPRDAYWSWGLHDSFIVVIPSLGIVASRAGSDWRRKRGERHYDVLRPFLQPICAAAEETNLATTVAPYPRSRVIPGVTWSPVDAIVRAASGSDNWPIAWMNDGELFTAYGDGFGFKPKLKQKLSMGFARVVGGPLDFRGANVRTESGERTGDGRHGIKASGLLMVDGVLYLLARNAENSRLAWSTDRGETWAWSDWKMSTSFGCPSFVHFGKDYSGVPRKHAVGLRGERWVYIISPDSASAYKPADRMVMARVRASQLRLDDAYEYFVKTDGNGDAIWSDDIEKRGAVFSHVGRCYRSAMSYNRILKRYLWCQVLPESKHAQGPRFQGGFGIYESSEPWGPWATVFFTEDWDVGPGESSRIPPKWISSDGKTIHLLFSGDDCFSVRRGELQVAPNMIDE